MECWLSKDVELKRVELLFLPKQCHYEVEGHINTIVLNGNNYAFLFFTASIIPECKDRVRNCGVSLKAGKKKNVGSDCSPKTVFILRPEEHICSVSHMHTAVEHAERGLDRYTAPTHPSVPQSPCHS